MPVTVSYLQPADGARACAIHFDTMGREHVFVDEGYPRHWTTPGRKAALQRHTDPRIWTADPSMHHLKLVDESLVGERAESLGTGACDPFIGFGTWQVKRPGADMSYLVNQPRDKGDWWLTQHDKRFVEWLTREYFARRRQMLVSMPAEQSAYCVHVLAIMPGFQGRGAGERFLKWGMDQADREGAMCTVESALSAEGFYLKYGFETLEHVRFTPPPEFADKGAQEVKWIVGQPRKG